MFEHHTLLHVLSEHCPNTVWTCSTLTSMCSNHVQTVFKHHALLCVLSDHCLDSVQTCSTLASMHLNCVQTARHAVVCCSNTVRTVCSCLAMFEHHTLLHVLSEHCPNSIQTCHTFISMCSNHVQTARHAVVCCSNTVRTVWSCLTMFKVFEHQCSKVQS